MHVPPRFFALSLLLLPAISTVALAQGPSPSGGPRPCGYDWTCAGIPSPLGFEIRSVDEDGRYLTLDDGSVWEVEISNRATTAAWQPQDFVAVRSIAAPLDDYAWLFSNRTNTEERAAVRLVGRRPRK